MLILNTALHNTFYAYDEKRKLFCYANFKRCALHNNFYVYNDYSYIFLSAS